VADALSIDSRLAIIGQAAHGDRCLEMLLSLRPQVAVVDVNLPGLNGQQITHEITSERVPTRVILMTAYDDGEQMLHAAIAGAAAFCSKDVQPDALTKMVFEVAGGNYVMGGQPMTPKEFEAWLKRQLESVRRSYSEPGNHFHPLSDREMEVLVRVVDGKSNKEIAVLLGISHQTVKNHVTAILRKFGVEDRTQAVVYALKRGWVKLDYETRFQE
jgi:DNA-binding NarL/FixJ family response regulator